MSELILKSESTTDDSYGCYPHLRSIDEHLSKAVINLDKTSGPSSHEIDAWVKRISKIEKVGHGGTLDPKVTGVFPIGLNSATRVMQLLLTAPKEYVCLMHLHKRVGEKRIADILNEFTGKILQTPPLNSAVKRDLRVRTIYDVKLLEIDNQDVLFKIECEAGTYVRTYCYDIGEALGVGAHMAELRRTKVGDLTEANKLTRLQDIADAFYYLKEEDDPSYIHDCTMPMEDAISHMPKIIIKDTAVDAIANGAELAAGGIVSFSDDIKRNNEVAIFTLKGELVAAGKSLYSSNDLLHNEKGIMVETKHVYIEPGIYPRSW